MFGKSPFCQPYLTIPLSPPRVENRTHLHLNANNCGPYLYIYPMFIKVINWSSHAILTRDPEPFYLEKDNWDDNYYKTRYHLHLSGDLTDDGNPLWIGEVKILRKGQRRDDGFQLEPGRIDFLDFRFCSIGQSLDYYERLSRIDKDLRYKILSAMRDIVIFPEFKKSFENEDGLEVSLYRFLDRDDDLFTLAQALISDDWSNLDPRDVSFNFQYDGLSAPVAFNFEVPDHKYGDEEEPQNRIHVLAGKEDCSKDKFLAKLAKFTFASNDDRDLLQNDGTLEPFNIVFSKVICLSYSPTLAFRVPAIYIHEKEQLTMEIQRGEGRFVYCGNHDLARELEESLKSFNIDTDGRVWEFDIPTEESAFLKTNEELTLEFVRAMEAIEQDLTKQDLLDDVFGFMKGVPDLQFITNIEFPSLREHELAEFFEHLAGESQVLLHAVVHLILCITPKSLVLFNAPETYLRPTRVSFLMQCAKHLLDRQDSLMIVATESFEILRDTKSKDVTILRKEGDVIEISTPEIETYGESLETITALINGTQKNNSQDDPPQTETLENFIQDS